MMEKLNKHGNRRGMHPHSLKALQALQSNYAKRTPEEVRKIASKGGLTAAANANADPAKKAAQLAHMAKMRAAVSEEKRMEKTRAAARALAERIGPEGRRKRAKFAGAMRTFRARGYLVEVPKVKK